MTFEAFLEEFRNLGGFAENVRLGEGASGRGLFPIDPARPAVVHTPDNLLIPTADLELADGRMVVRAGSLVGGPEREFFERYEALFGWGVAFAGEERQAQSAWYGLPPAVTELLKSMGGLQNPLTRFAFPSPDVCLQNFVRSRHFWRGGRHAIAPIVDLVNHSNAASGYVTENGIGVSGTFSSEILVRYNEHDAWAHAVNYGFSDACTITYSLGAGVGYGTQLIQIERDIDATEVADGVAFPRSRLAGDVLNLSHLVLGNTAAMDLPRAVFRRIMRDRLVVTQADEVFDTILLFNRQKFIELLRLLEGYDGALFGILRSGALHQLSGLSACIGARPL